MSHETGRPAPAPQRDPRLPAPGAPACRGGRMTLTTPATTATATTTGPKPPTPLMSLTYAVRMIVGTMVIVAGAGAHFFAAFFAEREAARCG
ncbi:hypothetical protein OG863_30655 [Streptomyces decoyicus]|uniref:Integral membrane protein n=1 Tax=Streptomyces decoyicus TaxID=249567 RepID=A0ABZ1FPB8_9ACTN|nr:hypothetical protein [Streptomyces decoyicus]WSB71961.1 hypothetical protein OG863_30655 [Streptomyces decoyicus]